MSIKTIPKEVHYHDFFFSTEKRTKSEAIFVYSFNNRQCHQAWQTTQPKDIVKDEFSRNVES